MKKVLTILLTLLMVFTLFGCNTNQDNNTTQEEVVEPDNKEVEILGGYEDVEDGTLTDELKDIFTTALDGLLGAKYEPVELVATQVVAGINYKILATGTKTTNPVTQGKYYITIYKDLQGNVKLLDIETIEETSATPKKEVDKTINYWVVFYNPDGNELQRTAQKYGTTPKYEAEEPYYWDIDYWYRFICWTDKDGNEIKEFKPITGNTYIYAKYEIGGENKPVVKGSEPAPAPAPEPAITTIILQDPTGSGGSTSTTIAYGDYATAAFTQPEHGTFTLDCWRISVGGVKIDLFYADGTCKENVANFTDSSGKWIVKTPGTITVESAWDNPSPP